MSNVSFKEKLIGCNIDLDALRGKTFLVTGATGLIGKVFSKNLLKLSETERLCIKMILLVRNKMKLCDYLLEQEKLGNVSTIECDICNFNGECSAVDYIVHCASITESKMMIDNPVELIKTNVYGTFNVLDYARKKGIKAFVYLSSMETYGFSVEDTILSEDKMQYLNPLEIRSCYPESKRMAENICMSYASEYGVPIKIIRLAQTFGAGVNFEDKRVFAEFARCAVEKKDIVLQTEGLSSRMYLDVEDAIIAILSVLINGVNFETYNVANKETYCSIVQMASLVAKHIGHGEIKVRHDIGGGDVNRFSPPHKFYLDVTRIEQIGWKPYTDLIGMYKNMILSWNYTL